MTNPPIEDLLRPLAPRVLGALVRRYGHFDLAEDAVQEALLAGATQWPTEGIPANPRAWLVTVASRRLTDILRSELARRRREEAIVEQTLAADRFAPGADAAAEDADDTLILLFMCCHPSLTQASQIALTLRAIGGLTTAEVARALLVPEDTITRRISRAKQAIKDSAIGFRLPSKAEREDRLDVVLHILYLIFNEGYVSTAGSRLQRLDLAGEAIRLARMTHSLLPEDPEVSGLLALMLLTDARRDARSGPSGELVPMAEQDRNLWDRCEIAEGIKLVDETVERGIAGPYLLQAAIAAVHDRSPSAETTDWVRIEQLYEQLATISPSPVVELNRAVAVAMARGAAAGIELLATLEDDKRIADDHRLYAVRAHLLEMLDRPEEAREAYEAAASRTGNLVQQRYLRNRAARLSPDGKAAPVSTPSPPTPHLGSASGSDRPGSAQEQLRPDATAAGRADARALVLGGGGSTGNAWLIGVIAGLFDAGLDVTTADLTIGTSAGSTAAAQIAGASPVELLAAILATAPQQRPVPVEPGRRPDPSRPVTDPLDRMRAIIASAEDAADMRRKIGAEALSTDAASDGTWQAQWRTIVAARLPSQLWPERPLLITAVDAETGEAVVFDRHSGVDLADAVAASCAIVLPYRIGKGSYIDGGFRSNADNADLAAGYGRVLVLSPFGGRSLQPPEWGNHLATQIDELRAGGSKVETIFPDGDGEQMVGLNAMDPSRRLPAARAGYDQGRALAANLTEFWR